MILKNKPFRFSSIFIFAGLMGVVLLFQNCSGGFNTSEMSLDISSSGSPPGPATKRFAHCLIENQPPAKFSGTCLAYLSGSLGNYPNFVEYEPQYPLYSDGSTKRRFIYLPPEEKIDTSDPDNWVFPQGTILYKQFSLNGKVIETRQIEKIGPGVSFSDWRFTVYAHLANQSDAVAVANGFNEQAADILAQYSAGQFKDQYKVATPDTCVRCHGSTRDVVRGFNYLQLSSANTRFNLNSAAENGFLSHIPLKADEIPGSATDKAAVGYIQSNCVSCHNGVGPGPGNYRHLSTATTFSEEAIVQRAFASPGLIVPGSPDSSRLHNRFAEGSMPAVRPVIQDSQGVALIRKWILEMNPP